MRSALLHTLVPAAVLAACSVVHAAPVSLGVAGDYNLVSLGDLKATSDVEGALAVGGDMDVSGYAVNANHRAVDGNALVVGGKLKFHNGSIQNGNAWVGGTRDLASFGFNGAWAAGQAPISFEQIAADMQALSQGLAGVPVTGSSTLQWGGIQLTGTQAATEVFGLSAADLQATSWGSLSNAAADATLILNISGAHVKFSGGFPNVLSNYNVLYNFFEATTLEFSNIGIYGSVLAPWATVEGGSGQINGNVVVAAWNSGIQVNANRYFEDAELPGYTPPAAGQPLADEPNQIPEPGSMVLVAAALAALVWQRRSPRASRRTAF